MRICEIYIEEFGGISNKKVVLRDGFNLICGANESGKSTLCSFIKYVFYGFSGSEERREKSNFKTGASSGYITVEDENGEKYRIERSDSERSRGRLRVLKEADGSELSVWKESFATPGDYFFGVNERLYTRSVYVSQESGAELDGGSAEAVSNLLISGNEAINLGKAKSALDNYRKALSLKRGRGGRIADAEDKLSSLNENFKKSVELKERMRETASEINRIKRELNDCNTELQDARDSLKKAKATKINGLLKNDEDLKTRIEALASSEKKLTEANTLNGFLPSETYIRELEISEATVSSKNAALADLKKTLSRVTEEKKASAPLGYREYSEMGGRSKLREHYKKLLSAKRRLQLFTVIPAIIAIASFVSLFLKSFGIQIGQSVTITAISSAAVLIFGAFFLHISLRLHKLNQKLFITAKRPYVKAFAEFDAYEEDIEKNTGSLSSSLKESEKSAEAERIKLSELLGRWGKPSVKDAKDAFSKYTSDRTRLRSEREKAANEKNALASRLSDYTVEEISEARALISETDITDFGNESPAELSASSRELRIREKIKELSERADRLRSELNKLEIKHAEMRGESFSDPLMLSAEIDEANAKLSRLRFKYAAAETAINALERAENSIRHTVLPYLNERAGEYFSALTQNRYEGLLLDEKMSLQYRDAETGTTVGSSYLSGGSADLAWICLRLALHKKLSESRPLPIILDECFVYFDDGRLTSILEKLTDIADGGTQILLFSASSRERDILRSSVNTVRL